MRRSPELVLVHGLWHQPEHFSRCARVLRERGYVVRVPRLHRGSLAADVAAVQDVVDRCADSPVLIGHSYGGAVIGQVSGAAAMLFVTAFVLEAGECCAEVADPPACLPAIVSNPDGSTSLDPSLVDEFFYADCSPEDVARAAELLVSQARGHGRGLVVTEAWRAVPTRYVVCSQDRAIDVGVQRRLAARCDSVGEWRASHSPFVSMPEALADELEVLLAEV